MPFRDPEQARTYHREYNRQRRAGDVKPFVKPHVIVFGMTSACSVIREHQEKKQQELEEEIAFNEQREEQIVRYLNNSVEALFIDREQQAAAPDLSEITFQDLLIYLDDDTITDLQNSSSLDFYSPLLGQVFTILTDQEVEVVLIELPYGGNHLIFEFR